MIVVDSSALIAILFDEPEKGAFKNIITGNEPCVISAVNAHETLCVIRIRNGLTGVAAVGMLLADNAIEIIAFDEAQVRAAAIATTVTAKGSTPKPVSTLLIARPMRSRKP